MNRQKIIDWLERHDKKLTTCVLGAVLALGVTAAVAYAQSEAPMAKPKGAAVYAQALAQERGAIRTSVGTSWTLVRRSTASSVPMLFPWFSVTRVKASGQAICVWTQYPDASDCAFDHAADHADGFDVTCASNSGSAIGESLNLGGISGEGVDFIPLDRAIQSGGLHTTSSGYCTVAASTGVTHGGVSKNYPCHDDADCTTLFGLSGATCSESGNSAASGAYLACIATAAGTLIDVIPLR